jgi:hypothetical protein
MRTAIGLAALLLGLALASPASAQDTSDYWNTPRHAKPKPPPAPSAWDKVKTFTAKAFDIDTYLPPRGSTTNSIDDPRLLPTTGLSHIADDLIQKARPEPMPKIILH